MHEHKFKYSDGNENEKLMETKQSLLVSDLDSRVRNNFNL